jgi:tRNA/rRNA methyltransferase
MPPSLLTNVRIVLVEPAGARNVGSVARVMKNMGLHQLMVVNPQCDPFGEEARRMAVHGDDVLHSATIAQTLPDGLAGCVRAIATTSIPRAFSMPLETPSVALPWLLDKQLSANSVALIFGPEDRGLNNDELSHAHRLIAIPTHPTYSSLNLAQAVGICCYELYQISLNLLSPETVTPQASDQGESLFPVSGQAIDGEPLQPAALDRLEGFYQQLETLLLDIGYLHPHTADSRMQKFRRLFNRAMPTDDEVSMLRGILSQMKWAAQAKNKL